ncbi:hypothetical protein V500_03047 [Pseudogymnoascus sp. VKM F-4518 (FW-2643)]|nr:hypothetical protein V500_03047 [Pseudogymnoascus sp. VKM F-4518 (FW-2643)]
MLLKWIKQLTISGYAPSYLTLREIVDELRTNQSFISQDALHDASQSQLNRLSQLQLGKEWVSRFIKRHEQLQVVFGRRIESLRMDGATKPMLTAWFDAYKKIVHEKCPLPFFDADGWHSQTLGADSETRHSW